MADIVVTNVGEKIIKIEEGQEIHVVRQVLDDEIKDFVAMNTPNAADEPDTIVEVHWEDKELEEMEKEREEDENGALYTKRCMDEMRNAALDRIDEEQAKIQAMEKEAEEEEKMDQDETALKVLDEHKEGVCSCPSEETDKDEDQTPIDLSAKNTDQDTEKSKGNIFSLVQSFDVECCPTDNSVT